MNDPRVKWIAAPPEVQGLPWFRRDFTLAEVPAKALCRISGLGFHLLFLNGRRADDARLAPTPSRYDVRTWYREIEVARFLRKGRNRCEIRLGGGWYAGGFTDVNGNEMASYRSVPKAAMRLFCGHLTLLATDENWLCARGPVLSDSPRTGEVHDARLAHPENWRFVRVVQPPGGRLARSAAPPVLAFRPRDPQEVRRLAPDTLLYDFGCNLTGTARMALQGPAGGEVTLRYGELLDNAGRLSQENINWYVKKDGCQTDRYLLAGAPHGEVFQPDFSWHGFRYIQATAGPGVEIRKLQAIPLRSGFSGTGAFLCASRRFSQLLAVVKRTLETNFVGYPTDCPHREKNGWTADAHLAADSLLAWFDATANYEEFIDTIFDYQRPNGQLPGMVPGGGHGWHWDFGPVWDSAALLLVHLCWQFSGDDTPLKRHYRNLRRYLEFQSSLAVGGLLRLGPGDWNPPPGLPESSPVLVGNAYRHRNLLLMAGIARHLGHSRDAAAFAEAAKALRRRLSALRPATATELGCLLECGLGNAAMAERLARQVRAHGCKAYFGIVGAKAVPRALAAYGHVDEAFGLFVQPGFPGWQWMLRQGATTLWETWDGRQSQNHPMFGDAAGWAWRFLAGFQILLPGFRKVRLAPQFPKSLRTFGWSGDTPAGRWSCHWHRRHDGAIEVNVVVPKGAVAELHLPGQTPSCLLEAGEHVLITSSAT